MRTPSFLKPLLPGLYWPQKSEEKVVYLTFDDGPIPQVTPWVLDLLKKYQAKATFFCIADNVRKHPAVFERLQEEGHRIGNHTFNHLNGVKTNTKEYLKNVETAHQLLNVDLFRPPYGKLKPSQYHQLKKQYKIVLWDVLSRDYNVKLTGEYCSKLVLNQVKPGDVIVFHDSLKAWDRLSVALPIILEELARKGYRFEALS